ncbi:MAG TPA: ABC transporter substrate-binding protein [Pseudonocardiaceae bacterium]|nr:ABC transporter substrate-binding protein [Pseudonocardiaceae bacterium]
MKPHNRLLATTTTLATGLAVTIGLAGCAGASGAGSAAPVPSTVNAAALSAVTLRVADQKGSSAQILLKAAGLDNTPYRIQWSTYTSGPPELQAAAADAVDVGLVGNTPPIFSAAGNAPLDIVGALKNTVGDAVVLPGGSTITSLADLRGKKIAVAKGSSANGTLLKTLSKAGLKPTDVSIDYLQPGDAYSAFSTHRVDAWVVWEPYVTEALRQPGARALLSENDTFAGSGLAGGAALSNGLSFEVAARNALTDPGKNTALSDYVTRIAKAEVWAGQHPDAWAAIWSQQSGLPLDVAKAAVHGVLLTPEPLDDSVVSSEQSLADAFTSAQLIPGKVAIAGFVDRRFNSAVQSYRTQAGIK